MGSGADATTKDRMMWVWGVFSKMMLIGAGGTLEVFFKVLEWSFDALFHGTWPTHDWRCIQTFGLH